MIFSQRVSICLKRSGDSSHNEFSPPNEPKWAKLCHRSQKISPSKWPAAGILGPDLVYPFLVWGISSGNSNGFQVIFKWIFFLLNYYLDLGTKRKSLILLSTALQCYVGTTAAAAAGLDALTTKTCDIGVTTCQRCKYPKLKPTCVWPFGVEEWKNLFVDATLCCVYVQSSTKQRTLVCKIPHPRLLYPRWWAHPT